jgi:hypothetical protein
MPRSQVPFLVAVAAGLAVALAGCGGRSNPVVPWPGGPPPYRGLLANPGAFDVPDSIVGALVTAHASGADLYYHFLTWADFESTPGVFETPSLDAALGGTQGLGYVTYVNLAPINTNVLEVPADLAGRAWDDTALVRRFDQAVDAMASVVTSRPCVALALGNEVDAWFGSHPGEFAAYRALVAREVARLHAALPGTPVGVCTISPVLNPNASYGDQLATVTDLAIYTYYPFQSGSDFVHRPPATLDADFGAMAARVPAKPWALQEVGYSSSAVNGSSPALQADFMNRLRRRLARESRSRLMFASWAFMSDFSPGLVDTLVAYYGADTPGFRAYLGNLGLRDTLDAWKPAWDVWRGP